MNPLEYIRSIAKPDSIAEESDALGYRRLLWELAYGVELSVIYGQFTYSTNRNLATNADIDPNPPEVEVAVIVDGEMSDDLLDQVVGWVTTDRLKTLLATHKATRDLYAELVTNVEA